MILLSGCSQDGQKLVLVQLALRLDNAKWLCYSGSSSSTGGAEILRQVAVLPTGDWAELTPEPQNIVTIYEMTEAEFSEFLETGEEDTSIGRCVGEYNCATGFEKFTN